MYAIKTDNLTKLYGKFAAVNGVSVEVPMGSITGLVGKNGAGKTTLMRIIAGLIFPNSGTFHLLEGESCKNKVSAIIETPSIHLSMTVKDNLILQAKLLQVNLTDNKIDQLLDIVDLTRAKDQKAKSLSLGMKQRLSIGMCLVNQPQLILLDEPTNGLDPQGIKEMRELFLRINSQYGTTLLISSHLLDELSKFATHYIFMDKGKIVKCLDARQLEGVGGTTTRIVVDDMEKAVAILKENKYSGTAENGRIDIKSSVDPTAIILLLANNGVKVNSIHTIGDNLEDFYIALVGGDNNA